MASNADGGLAVAVLAQNSTVWHARQVNRDGDWSGWISLGNPVSGGTITPPALVQDPDGRLELARLARGLGLRPGPGPVTSVAPAVAQDQDGRLEVHLRIGEQLWHSWQKVTGGPDWVPWA